MAHVLNIVYGSTTIALNTGSFRLLEYDPRTPDENEIRIESPFMDGAERPIASYRNLGEVARVAILGEGTIATVQNAIRDINRAFAQARRRQRTHLGDKVFLNYIPDGYSSTFRSEIIGGRAELSEGAMGWQWLDRNIEIRVAWERRFFWEGLEAQIPLTNANGTGNTTGLAVWNHDDAGAGHDNYVEIAAADVSGDLAAAPRLEITNTFNSSSRAYELSIAQNVQSSPATLVHMLEAEAGTGGTTSADASCSGGSRKDLAWSVTTEAQLLSWTLDTTLLNACAGNYFRMLTRFASSPTYSDAWLRFRIKYGVSTIWEGPQVLLASLPLLQDLGVLQLPPYLVGAGDLSPLSLVLYGQRNQSGTHTVYLDFVQLSALDGWRKLTPRGYGLAYGMRVIDDGIDDFLYADDGATYKAGYYVGSGERIQVWPNAKQRLYFLHNNDTGGSQIDRTLSVKAFYRPRRLVI